MFARVRLRLPAPLYRSVQAEALDPIKPREFEHDGYRVRLWPPYRGRGPQPLEQQTLLHELERADEQASNEVTIDGGPTILGDVLMIDLHCGHFDRTPRTPDPAVAAAFTIARSWHHKYRTTARAPNVPTVADGSTWLLEYLDDDGTLVPKAEGVVQWRASLQIRMDATSFLTPEVWKLMAKLPDPHETPACEALLLDAFRLQDHVGVAVALAYAAVEVKLTTSLEALASHSPDKVSPDLWAWITDRGGDYRKEPSLAERADVLTAVFTGASLRTYPELWKGFQELRAARNSFVHEGRPSIGGKVVPPERVGDLLRSAQAIVDFYERSLPAEQRRPKGPTQRHEIKVTASRRV